MDNKLIKKIIRAIDYEINDTISSRINYREKNNSIRRSLTYREEINVFYIELINLKFVKRFFKGERKLKPGEVFSNFLKLSYILGTSNILTDEEVTIIYFALNELNYTSYQNAEMIKIIPEMILEEGEKICKCSYQDIIYLNHLKDYDKALESALISDNPIVQKMPSLLESYNNYYSELILNIMYSANTLATFDFNIENIKDNEDIEIIKESMKRNKLLNEFFINRVINYLKKYINKNPKDSQNNPILNKKKSCTY